MPAPTSGPFAHAALPQANHDELSRELYVESFRSHVSVALTPGNRRVYDTAVLPQFVREHGREPNDRMEVTRAMERHPFNQVWASLLRTNNDLVFDSSGETVARQMESLRFPSEAGGARGKGSLKLNPELEVPRYVSAVDIHRMPGNYHADFDDGDASAGALYDRGVFVHFMGGLGEANDGLGWMLIRHLEEEHPGFAPRRILDMGCTIGHSTLPYCDAFPDADIYAIDISPSVLRYAHRRAESMGKVVHFQQQNAEATDFESGSFDLIVSHILLHETSNRAMRNIMAESRRLLAPGGIALHLEGPQKDGRGLYEQFLSNWNTHYNNEPYAGTLHDTDMREVMREAGFSDNEFGVLSLPISLAKKEGDFGARYGGALSVTKAVLAA